ncbi:MAG: type II toxin-antitoxin system RelE/ParE family toxin [bacterium]
MPETEVCFYRENDGTVPVLDWLWRLRCQDRKAFANCVALIRRLAMFGYELRRPQVDYLRDGIYELRAKSGHVNYRVLYFFCGQNVALLAHGLTKEAKVPESDIDCAVARKRRYEQDPERHTAQEDFGYD